MKKKYCGRVDIPRLTIKDFDVAKRDRAISNFWHGSPPTLCC
jgi:hypothetical protein